MPVTFPIANLPAEPHQGSVSARGSSSDPLNLLFEIPDTVLSKLPTTHIPAKLLQSSVDGIQDVTTAKNGFVHGVMKAYSKHHNLIIRPDDVWIAILSQLNFYVNAHAEELRGKFVDHEGKQDLVVTSMAPNLDQMDFGDLAVQMTGLIDKNVKDKSLVPWVLPNFSTTTADDTVICSALIMSTLKQYFNYIMLLGCGIPFVTLEGTKADWQSILDRVDKILEFGEEPTEWASMLRAILKRFVRAFDAGGPKSDQIFWERMVNETPGGSSTPFISGWLSAFCAWDNKGVFFASRKYQDGFTFSDPPSWVKGLTFDSVWFPRVNVAPEGYAEVDIKVVDQWEGKSYDCTMLAGHIGYSMVGTDKRGRDTVRIAPQWFMYIKGDERKADEGFWSIMDH
ncbi:hypothetical protein H0H87_007026 [Tephrocybe sp. NHM501043]|nr:hypothetical protein H0H87_007026 [Tephrocybe sp. NHM501043]